LQFFGFGLAKNERLKIGSCSKELVPTKGFMEITFFPVVAGLLAGLDSVAGIIQAVSMVVCLASLLGAVFQGFHERSVGGVKTALTIAAIAGLSWTIVTAVYTAGGFSANIQPNAGAVN
jgi:hypothetical protein